MTNQKQSSKRQTIVIAILAVLLVGLLAFNVTYAFFTDKQTNTDNFQFGTIELNASNVANKIISVEKDLGREKVMPGDKISGDFGIKLADDSEDAFVRYQIKAEANKEDLFGADTAKFAKKDGDATPVIAYIKGEFVQARIAANGDVTIVAGAENNEENQNAIKNYSAFTTYTVNKVKTVITFKDNTDAIVASVKVGDVDKTEDADINAAIKLGAELAAQEAAIDKAIAGVNNAFQATLAGLAEADYIAAGDGWIYKKAAITKTTGVDKVAIAYTLPLELGNALQNVKVNFDLTIDAVQAANAEDVKVSSWPENVSSTAQEVSAVKVFYAAIEAHGGIEAR